MQPGGWIDLSMDASALGSEEPVGGRPIDTGRPQIDNPDGSYSTERTITIEVDGRHYVIPTIVGGKQLEEEQAVQLFKQGVNKPVGVFDNADEAEAYAQQRSQQIDRERNPQRYEQQDEQDMQRGFEKVRSQRYPQQRPDVAADPNRSAQLNARQLERSGRGMAPMPNGFRGKLAPENSELGTDPRMMPGAVRNTRI
jgi:hypothetical protein